VPPKGSAPEARAVALGDAIFRGFGEVVGAGTGAGVNVGGVSVTRELLDFRAPVLELLALEMGSEPAC
jgi:hypothetical protein